MDDAVRLTFYEKKLLAKIGAGTLCCEAGDTQAGIDNGGLRYWVEPGGRSARPASAKALIKRDCWSHCRQRSLPTQPRSNGA